MKNRHKLKFSSEKQAKVKKLRSFIISFTAFVIVLGSISLFMFFKSINFDSSNIFIKGETTTGDTTEKPSVQTADLVGKTNLVFACYDAQNKLSFSFFIGSDMENKTVSILNLPSGAVSASNNSVMSLDEHFNKNGISAFKIAVSDYTKLEVNKYIKVSESNFKKIIDKIGAIDVNISAPLNYKSNEFNLTLNAGKQNLSGDMFVKYLKITNGKDGSEAFVNFVNTLISNKTIESQDSLFYDFINLIDTDVSVVDYSGIRDVIFAFSNLTSDKRVIKAVEGV